MVAQAHWQHLEHGADIGVRGFGRNLAEAFEQAALALSAVVTDPANIAPGRVVEVQCEAADEELLLLDWLNEVIYQMATRRMLFGEYKVRIDNHRLEARLYGEPVDRARHQPAVEIKGATFTELRAYRSDTGEWVAQCIIDV